MMIYHHCYRSLAKFEDYDVIFRGLTQGQAVYLGSFCKICVAIFAFVSGYGLMSTYLSGKGKGAFSIVGWIKKHMISTASGLWFTAPAAYLIYGCFFGFRFAKWGDTIGEKVLGILADCLGISNLLGTKSINGAWWYMSAALIYILLIPLFAEIMERFGAFLCMSLVVLLPRILGTGYQGSTSAWSFLLIMTMGMACCRSDFFTGFHKFTIGKSRVGSDIIKGVALAILMFLCYFGSGQIPIKLVWEYKFAFIPFIYILFFKEFFFRIPIFKEILAFFGRHSMYIWLLHSFVQVYLGKNVFAVREFWLVPVIILLISLVLGLAVEFLRRVSGYDNLMKKLTSR